MEIQVRILSQHCFTQHNTVHRPKYIHMTNIHLAVDLNTRLTAVINAETVTNELGDLLADLGEHTRWHTSRLNEIKRKADELMQILGGVLDVSDVKPPEVKLPKPAFSPGVSIPVGHLIEQTEYGALLYSTPALIGGEWTGRNGKVYIRPNGRRHFPAAVIVKKYDGETRSIRVTESWYNEDQQADLRAYVAAMAK